MTQDGGSGQPPTTPLGTVTSSDQEPKVEDSKPDETPASDGKEEEKKDGDFKMTPITKDDPTEEKKHHQYHNKKNRY